MAFQAVIFDLFGTLIDERAEEYAVMMHTMALLLGVTGDALYAASAADAGKRDLGAYRSVAHQFNVLCLKLGVSPAPDHVAAAIEEYTQMQMRRLVPRDGVLDTLAAIGERGLKRGLISNASQVIVDLWSETAFPPYFEDVILSSRVKVTKPDPAIYLLACNQLGVSPADCLDVGDGGSSELTGAAHVGMTPLLIVPSHDDPTALGAKRQAWDGQRITSIAEVLGLLDA
jgi:putative hydrolase of the HAD superfamily